MLVLVELSLRFVSGRKDDGIRGWVTTASCQTDPCEAHLPPQAHPLPSLSFPPP